MSAKRDGIRWQVSNWRRLVSLRTGPKSQAAAACVEQLPCAGQAEKAMQRGFGQALTFGARIEVDEDGRFEAAFRVSVGKAHGFLRIWFLYTPFPESAQPMVVMCG